jgi:PKD repeat protein
MRKLPILTLLLSLLSSFVLGQCPPNLFAIGDTVCPLQNLTINNSSSTAISTNWDFCVGDLDSIPSGTALPIISGSLNYPQNMKLIKVNGNYYGFFPNLGASYITRYDFGNSPNNTPTAINLNSDPLLSTFSTGIDIVEQNSKWYAFVTQYSGNKLIRLELDSITQINPTIIDLSVSNLFNPYSIKIINGIGFITNFQTSDIARIDFGGNYSNIPISLPSINTGFVNNYGIDIAFDCASGKYIGYGTSQSLATIYKLDFGANLLSIPTITTEYNIAYGIQGLQIVEEKNNWHLFAVSTTNLIYHFTTGITLNNPLTFQYSSNLGSSLNDPKNIQMTKIGSDWIGIISNNLLFSIVKIQFPQGCTTGSLSSNLISPSNININPRPVGYQYIELEEQYTNGNIEKYLDSVYIDIPPPSAEFIFSTPCKASEIQFSDISNICYGNLTNWEWDFGDGNLSFDQNPIHIYTTSGTFQVQLIITSGTNQKDTITKPVTVHDRPIAGFVSVDSTCANSIVLVTDTSLNIDGFLQSWNWNFGDNITGSGQNIDHVYQNDGIFTIQLIVSSNFGCIDSVSKQILVNATPIPSFQIYNSCIGETAQFVNLTDSNSTTLQSFYWDFGDSNQSNGVNVSHTYNNSPGNYDVQLIATATNGCSDTSIQNIRIGNKPIPWFNVSSDTICSNTTIQFIDSSFSASGETISGFNWNFGDGSVDSINNNPNHNYLLPGTYQVSLTVFSPSNCDSTITRSVFVIESPSSNFNTTDVCLNDSTNYLDLSTSPLGSNIVSWSWNFGNGDSSNIQNPSNLFGSPGLYNVTLQVTSNVGCKNSITKTANVNELPIVNFSYGKTCTGSPVQFNDSSSVLGGTINSWNWNFENNTNNSTLQNPNYIFDEPLAYPITLTTTSNYGCIDSITKYVIINQSPEFTLSANDNCLGIPTTFQYIPAIGSTGNYTFLWLFGDSTASFNTNPSHTYSAPGNYIYQLTVTDLLNGCFTTINDSVKSNPKPIANFSVTNACVNTPIMFNDLSSVSIGNIQNYYWDFDTHGNSSIQSPNLTLTIQDSFPTKLIVTTDAFCKDSIVKYAQSFSLPNVTFTPNPNYGSPPLLVTFLNTSDIGDTYWTFGDGNSSQGVINSSNTYTEIGSYTVNLTIVNQNGCIDSAQQNVEVLSPYLDLSIEGITFVKENDYWKLYTTIRNTGINDIANFMLFANIQGVTDFSEFFTPTTIKAGKAQLIDFKTLISSNSIKNTNYVCVSIVEVNGRIDDLPSNDNKCISNSEKFEVHEIYPNPFGNEFNVGFNIPKDGKISFSIYNTIGQKIFEESNTEYNSGYNTISIDNINLNSGIYLFELLYRDEVIQRKIVKY